MHDDGVVARTATRQSHIPTGVPCRTDNEAANDAEKGCAASTLPPPPPDVPDGGLQAWLNCFGGFVAFFASFGIVTSYGVFQNNYKQDRLSSESESVIAIIGALQLFILYGAGPIVGKLFDSFGTRVMLPLGSFCIVFGLMMLSLAQRGATYQYFLAQGVLFGIGCALVFTPILALQGHYFRRWRALAIGIVAAGSALGGCIFPIMLQRLIPRIGFPWAVRSAAFVALACLAFSCAVCRTRLPLRPTSRAELLRCIDLGGFRDVRYSLAVASAFVTFYAIFIPYYYIQQYAELRGMSPSLSIYLVPLLNALGVPTRIAPGFLAKHLGVLNMMIVVTAFSGILILALWLPSQNNAEILAFSALYALSGAYISLLPAYVGIITPQPVYGARLGAMYVAVAVATLAGTPTGGALVGQAADLQHYRHLIGFSGALAFAGALILVLVWVVEARQMLQRRRQSKPGELKPLHWTDFRF